MNGLIRNNFYSMEGNLKLSLVISLFLFASSFLVPGGSFIKVIVAMQSFVFIANASASLHADTISKWSQFELTLPVHRRDILKAKYFSFSILLLLGLAMGGITTVSACITGRLSNLQPAISGLAFGFVLAAITVGIMYPLLLKAGTEKSELLLVLASVAAVGLMVLVAAALALVTGEMNMQHPLVGLTSAAAALAVFAASYFISVKIYQGKEFS